MIITRQHLEIAMAHVYSRRMLRLGWLQLTRGSDDAPITWWLGNGYFQVDYEPMSLAVLVALNDCPEVRNAIKLERRTYEDLVKVARMGVYHVTELEQLIQDMRIKYDQLDISRARNNKEACYSWFQVGGEQFGNVDDVMGMTIVMESLSRVYSRIYDGSSPNVVFKVNQKAASNTYTFVDRTTGLPIGNPALKTPNDIKMAFWDIRKYEKPLCDFTLPQLPEGCVRQI